MNIVLIGYRGAGKSVVGRRLAGQLQREFVDTDDLIEERLGAPIRAIVESNGWGHFRSAEKRIIEEISGRDHLVIAPGGGAVLDAANVTALKRNGLIIWLKADWQILRKRMAEDSRTFAQRPTLTGKGALEELRDVIAIRDGIYERAAEVQIDTSALNVKEVVGGVLSIFRKRVKGT